MRSKTEKIQTTLNPSLNPLPRALFSQNWLLADTLNLKCEPRMLVEGLKQSHTGSKMTRLRNYMVLRFRALYGSVFQGSDFHLKSSPSKIFQDHQKIFAENFLVTVSKHSSWKGEKMVTSNSSNQNLHLSALGFYNSWRRLCIYYSNEPCTQCPLFRHCMVSTEPEVIDPVEAIKVVGQWAMDHPVPSIDDCLDWLKEKWKEETDPDDSMYYSITNLLRELKMSHAPVEVNENDYFAAP